MTNHPHHFVGDTRAVTKGVLCCRLVSKALFTVCIIGVSVAVSIVVSTILREKASVAVAPSTQASTVVPECIPCISCWDRNGDGLCDKDTEDTNHDGECDALDCQGLRGLPGEDCQPCVNGTQGEIGPEGADGAVGPMGPAGLNGTDGRNGTDGVNGTDGAVGPQGPQGEVGPAGSNGTDGIDGIDGTNGTDGIDGTNGTNGIHCWDLNGNGVCDLGSEDINADGVCNVTDCRGLNGTDGLDGPQGIQGEVGPVGPMGLNGTDGIDGTNGVDGTNGIDGTNGTNGIDCWDLNGNGVCDLGTEDINSDGVCNVTDCAGPVGPEGPMGLNGTDGANGTAADVCSTSCPSYRILANDSSIPYTMTTNGTTWQLKYNDTTVALTATTNLVQAALTLAAPILLSTSRIEIQNPSSSPELRITYGSDTHLTRVFASRNNAAYFTYNIRETGSTTWTQDNAIDYSGLLQVSTGMLRFYMTVAGSTVPQELFRIRYAEGVVAYSESNGTEARYNARGMGTKGVFVVASSANSSTSSLNALGGPLPSGSDLGGLECRAAQGTAYPTTPSAAVSFIATEQHDTNRGTALVLKTTPNGGTTALTRVTVDHNGNVGFGDATSPSDHIHLAQATRPTLVVQHSGATAKARVFQATNVSRLDLSANCYYNGSSWLRDDTAVAVAMVRLAEDGAVEFRHAAAGANPATLTTSIFAKADGTVGFGTTTPADHIHLQQATRPTISLQWTGDTTKGRITKILSGNRMEILTGLYWNGTNWFRDDITMGGSGVGLRDGSINFYAVGSGANPASILQVMTVDSTSTLTVGNTNAAMASTLRVSTDGAADDNPSLSLFATGVAEWKIAQDRATSSILFSFNPASSSSANLVSTAKAVLTSSGKLNLGGASNANNQLEVNGGIRVQGTVSAATSGVGTEIYWNGASGGMFAYDRGTGAYKPLTLEGSTMTIYAQTGLLNLYAVAAQPIVFGTSNNERVRIDSSGNMYGSTDDTYFGMDTSSPPRLGITKKSGALPKFTHGSASTFAIARSSGTGIGASNTFTDELTIDTSGNVAVGAPSVVNNKFEVNGGMRVQGAASGTTSGVGVEIEYTSSTGYIRAYDRVGAGTWKSMLMVGSNTQVRAVTAELYIITELSQPIYFYTANTQRAYFDSSGHFVPASDNTYNLGTAITQRWKNLYVVNSPTVGSDRNLKTDIQTAPLGLDFLKTVRPVSYKMAPRTTIVTTRVKVNVSFMNENGTEEWREEEQDKSNTQLVTGTRRHYGFIAQEIKDSLDLFNVSTNDFAPFVDAAVDDPSQVNSTARYALRYEGFIPVVTKAVQELDQKTTPIEGAPASSSSPCRPGETRYTSTHLFMCVSVNQWKRTVWDIEGW